jgi:hypothetical protein
LQRTEARLGISRLGRRELAGVGSAAAGLGLLLGTGAAQGLPRTETAATGREGDGGRTEPGEDSMVAATTTEERR